MTNAEKSFGKEKEMYRNNINCIKKNLNYCKKNNLETIHLSSTSVYGKQAETVDETCEKKYLKPQWSWKTITFIRKNAKKGK